MNIGVDVAEYVKIFIAFLQMGDSDEGLVGGIRRCIVGGRFPCIGLAANEEPCAATYYDNKDGHNPRPFLIAILCDSRSRRIGKYSRFPFSCEQHDVRLEIAVGEEHLFLSLFGDTDRPHGHVGLARLHSGNLP